MSLLLLLLKSYTKYTNVLLIKLKCCLWFCWKLSFVFGSFCWHRWHPIIPNKDSLLKNSNIQEKRRSMLGDYTVYAILGFSVFCLITVGWEIAWNISAPCLFLMTLGNQHSLSVLAKSGNAAISWLFWFVDTWEECTSVFCFIAESDFSAFSDGRDESLSLSLSLKLERTTVLSASINKFTVIFGLKITIVHSHT